MRLSPQLLKVILGRQPFTFDYDAEFYRGKKVLITGGAGSLGTALTISLSPLTLGRPYIYDLPRHDVNDIDNFIKACEKFEPDIIFHCAAHKHAQFGEDDPFSTTMVNILGTQNIIEVCRKVSDVKIIGVSTCKAIEPQTVYGSSKLIMERLLLNAGHSVIRLFNTVDSSGNVFETWMKKLEKNEPLEYTDCERRFITMSEATSLAMVAGTLHPGRYMLGGTVSRHMGQVARDVAQECHSGRVPVTRRLRRGDRVVEPELGIAEQTIYTNYRHILQVINYHDGTDPIHKEEANEEILTGGME